MCSCPQVERVSWEVNGMRGSNSSPLGGEMWLHAFTSYGSDGPRSQAHQGLGSKHTRASALVSGRLRPLVHEGP